MKNRLKLLVAALGVGAIILAGCSSGVAAVETVAPTAAAEIIVQETDEIVLDIRTPEEFSQGVIEGAINIDFYASDFADQLDSLDKDAHYVVSRSTFAKLGFTNVTEIDGGIANWYNSGLPVVLP